MAQGRGISACATNGVHFLEPGQARLQRLLTAMRRSVPLTSLAEADCPPEGAYFTSEAEMARRFDEYPGALETSLEIAGRCSLELPLGVPHYPELAVAEGRDALDEIRQRALQGAEQRYGALTEAIRARLDHELEVIGTRGYAPLFLIMAEILTFARDASVPTASRGSASSSLVAHCLGITTPDPIAHNLYFERFLNPARRSPPDIDTDLCSTRREKVLRHVYEEYGEVRVAMVATINRLRSRSALREVAKAHGLSQAQIGQLTRNLPYRGWGPRAARTGDAYDEVRARFPQHAAIFDDAAALRKFPRHLSVHPGGIVIAPGRLTDLVPLHLASKGLVITQFDLDAVQEMGLVKIDLLGTRGLSVLGDVAEAVQGWNQDAYETSLEVLDAIPQDDPDTAALIRDTQTIGCFQIESPGMRATLHEVRADSPDGLLVALALYRPGPMTGGLKEAFVRRHLGLEPVQHIHPALGALLADTHGVILYQEQVLRIASELAGLSLADADLLRRAMSHFDPGERMQTLKRRFITGALEKSSVPPEKSEQIWELMAAFAGYGFPKAHAASYAQVAWQSAWCKAHYPAEFMAAVLANWGGFYRQPIYLNEARRMGLALRPPHINHSGREFQTVYLHGESVLYMGLNQVRELTRRTQRRILEGRPFRSLDDFLTHVDPRPLEAENLVRIGALKGLGSIPRLLERIHSGGWRKGQPTLPGMGLPEQEVEDWTLSQRLTAQRELLGVEVEAHRLMMLPESLRSQSVPTAEAIGRRGEEIQVLGTRLTQQRFFHHGQSRTILELEDLSGVLRVALSREQAQRYRRELGSHGALRISGVIGPDPLWQEGVLHARRIERIPIS
jgi:DNA-directed DNA polymerase III PolC